MLHPAIANLRSRAYSDALAKLETDSQREIFARLVHYDAATMLRTEASEQYRDLDEQAASRKDSQSLALVARQLEHVMTEVYEEEFPELLAAEGKVVDIDSSVPEGAETFTYYVYSAVGMARFSSAYSSRTSPRATIQGAKVSGNVENMEGSYGYTARDLRSAAFAGLPLESMLAVAERRAHAELLNKTALWGREDLGLPGVLNHPNMTITDAPDGAGASPLWADKTVDEILLDIATIVNTPRLISFGMRQTTDVFLSDAEYLRISQLRLGAGDGGMTVLDFAKKAHPGVTFSVLRELAATESDGNLDADAAFALVKDSRLVSLIVPMPFRQHPVQQTGLEFVVMCESSTGGIKCPEPMILHRFDGIGDS
jgi:hypothetical protein